MDTSKSCGRLRSLVTTITGYGGVGEIGGNAFLLEDGRSRIFLDFGKRFGNDPIGGTMRPGEGDYFDSFLQPRSASIVGDLLDLRLIPDAAQSYRQDLGGLQGPSDIDAVVVSHAHADHVGLVSLLKPDVPLLMSDESKATIASLQETGAGGATNELAVFRAKGYGYKKDGTPSTQPHRPDIPRPISDAAKMDIGDWDIQQFAVDHSIHGARGTVLAGKDVTVAYTGDFRLHGRDGDASKRFLEQAAGADVLVAEGTNVSQHHKHEGSDNELAVEGEIAELAKGEQGLVAISFPPRDLDRFLSVWTVAKRLGRRLAIPTRQAHLLDSLRGAGRDDLPDPRTDKTLAIHVRTKGRSTVSRSGEVPITDHDGNVEWISVGEKEWQRVLHSEYRSWEHPYLDSGNTVTSAEIGANPDEWVFSISYWTITDLLDVFPAGHRPGGLYIHSMTQPFNDEMEISDRKLNRWLDAFQLRRKNTHVSGHLSEDDLHWAIDEIGARKLVPIHSMHPELTAARYKDRTGHDAIMPQWGKAFKIG